MIGFLHFFLNPDRTNILWFLLRSGPYGYFSFLWKFGMTVIQWPLYFFNFSEFWSGPRTGPKKVRPGTDFFGLKSVPRTGPGSSPDQTPDHVPDRQKSGPRTGPTNLGPKIRYGPAVHDYDKLSCATSGGAGLIMIGWKFSNQSW